MSNYKILANILDQIRKEAPTSLPFYHHTEIERVNQARARAYIHLYLKASIGILDFEEREEFITDGTHDGGIDGYYIDEISKVILFIQSKFRTTENNFENKEISLEEILKMDIDRILQGEITHENGVPYNGKILGMQKRLKELRDIARYRYEVIILANLRSITDSKLRLLTSGIPAKVYDHKKTFSDLVFPIVTGSFYNYSDLCINVNLSNKSSGAHINYSVETSQGNCDITVLFIPLKEIGEIMHKYKNSILKYNPRSYLTLKEGSINSEIKRTVLKNTTNEFALFNNGITILSDETFFNQRIGQKDKAQLSIKNPQVINGGQTAYTLSLLYEDSLNDNTGIAEKLEKKEVLVKIITFSLNKNSSFSEKLDLIEEISEATNKQNQVNSADRSSNNPLLISSQSTLFNDFGLLLERKRGEFYDGLRYGYIDKSHIIDRGIFMRISFSSLGYPVPPKKEKQLLTEEKINTILNDNTNFKKYFFGCLLFSELQTLSDKNKFSESFSSAMFAIISVCSAKYYINSLNEDNIKDVAKKAIEEILNDWSNFEDHIVEEFHNHLYFNYNYNYSSKTYRLNSKFSHYYRSSNLAVDLNNYFFDGNKTLIEENGTRKGLDTIEKYLGKYLTFDLIEKIKPLINQANWFDELSIAEAAEILQIDPKNVRIAIKLITSKSYGYYFTSENEALALTASIPNYR
jgi:hypothetical protein